VVQRWPTSWMIEGSSLGRGWEYFSSPPHRDRLWGPPSLLSNGYQGLLPWGVKLTTHLYLVPKSRMRGAITPLPNTPSRRGARLKNTGITLPYKRSHGLSVAISHQTICPWEMGILIITAFIHQGIESAIRKVQFIRDRMLYIT
jgi:hypothetical protein